MNIVNIFQRQQQLSFIRQKDRLGKSANQIQTEGMQSASSFSYGNIILSVCRQKQSVYKRKKGLRWAVSFIPALVILLALTVNFHFPNTDKSEQNDSYLPDSYEELSPADQALYHIHNENFESAQQILDKALAESPQEYAFYCAYADLYDAQKDYDSEARILIYYLNNIIGTQNVVSSNDCYIRLRDFSKNLSDETQVLYDNCISGCEQTISQFSQMDAAIESSDYVTVLDISNSMKANRTSESLLIDYYFTAYNGLGEYELCASYLLSLSESDTLPDDVNDPLIISSGQIKLYMQKIYPLVSTETQNKFTSSSVYEKDS